MKLTQPSTTAPETQGERAYRNYAIVKVRGSFQDPKRTFLNRWVAVTNDGSEAGEPRMACGFVDPERATPEHRNKMYLLYWDGKREWFCYEDAFPKACSEVVASPLFATCVARMKISTDMEQ